MSPSTVAVTGASGFVGRLVCARLTAEGHNVVALSRRPLPPYRMRSYDLAAPLPADILAGVDTVVHCAYDLSLTDSETIARTNVGGTRRLLDATSTGGIRLVLLSSMSAYPGTEQIYGRAKLQSEAEVLAAGGEAVRLGLVWGGDEDGMIGTLRRLARLPVIPSFGRRLQLFTVHADDVAAGIAGLVAGPRVGQPVGLAHPNPVPFREILAYLRDGRRPTLVPVPWRPAYGAMRAIECVGGRLPVRADSLLGLVRPADHVPNANLWPALGVRLRPFGASGPDPLFPATILARA